ncbi:MAG: hypothetical protein IM662_02630 [Phenylobacterium sp.]|nr:hypothetical protein [Phenylobacterium sp.]MCA6276641.1 hypothetical protein [Phenylobacterium sp.]MCA6294228.1 hypothetical protein [Phenylobacterium sp.]
MSDIPPEILARIKSTAESEWPDDPDMQEEEIEADVEAYMALQVAPDDVPLELFEELKRTASLENDSYSGQLHDVTEGIEQYRYARATRAKIEPVRELLIRMEEIIAKEGYNPYTRNYGPGGVRQGDGREQRYSAMYVKDGEVLGAGTRPKDMPAEVLITGHYRFGANRLAINSALLKIIDMLEADYGLKIPRG